MTVTLRAAVEATLDELEAQAPSLEAPLAEAHRIYAAAALARGVSLARGSIAALDAGEVVSVGVLARPIWETWLAGIYLLLGGQEAWIRMHWAQVEHDGKVVRANEVDVGTVLGDDREALIELERQRLIAAGERNPDDEASVSIPDLWTMRMAELVGPMLAEIEGDEGNVLGAYDVLYRSHSTWDLHPGTTALAYFIDTDTEVGTAKLRPFQPWLDPLKSIGITAMHLALLGRLVFQAFDIATEQISNDLDRLLALLDPAA